MAELVLVVIFILIASAVCSGSEAALFSLSPTKAQAMAEAKRPGAKRLLAIRQNMTRPIATIVILNNLANIVGTFLVGIIATNRLDSTGQVVVPILLTFLVIVFAEILPKTIGERYCESISLIVAPGVRLLTWLLTPMVWMIEHITRPFTSKAALTPTTNEDEIKLLAQIGRKEGVINASESSMIERVFILNDRTAQDLMTPRVAMTYIDGKHKLKQVKDALMESQHSRILVIGKSIDHILGMVLKSELLAAMVEGQGERQVQEFVRDVRFTPKYTRADRLLNVFRETRQHLAVVVDDFGGTAGVITLEDVLEVLTGEIVDETDVYVDLQKYAREMGEKLHGNKDSSTSS